MWSNKKRLGLLAVFFLAVAGLAFSVTYKAAGSDVKSAAVMPVEGSKEHPYRIELKKENQDPVDLLIKKGEYVSFDSKDGGQHQIVQGGHDNTTHGTGSLDSGVFQADESYLLQFKEAGSYVFHDNYDHDYTITVLVYEPGKESKVE